MINYLINLIDLINKYKILNFFKKHLNQKKINVIDIGAHKGETINFFTDNFNVNMIDAFEPNIELYNQLKKKFNDKKVNIYNYGVGLKKEQKTLNVLIDSASSTFNKINTQSKYFERKKKYLLFGKKKSYFLTPQNTQVVNLSDFILYRENFIDVLKIDTEGFEYNILKGIRDIDILK